VLEPFHAFKAVLLRTIGLPLLVWFAAEWISGRVARPAPLVWGVIGWAAAGALATAFSLAPQLSLAGEMNQREGLLTTLSLAGLCLATTHAHRDERHVLGTLATALACGVAAGVYAQLQLAGLDPIRWQGVYTYAAQGGVALRPAGTLGNPILLGIVLAATLPVALAALASRSSRGSGSSDAAWLVPAAALVAASLLMTLSRARGSPPPSGPRWGWRWRARPEPRCVARCGRPRRASRRRCCWARSAPRARSPRGSRRARTAIRSKRAR
jgi:hypothetical protein